MHIRKLSILGAMVLVNFTQLGQAAIEKIQIQGNQRIEKQTILSHLDIKTGDACQQGKLDESLKRLYETGYFADVKLRCQAQTLVIDVTENASVNQIAFEGINKIPEDRLKEEVQIKPREIISRPRIQAAQQRILELYRRLGRYGATVEPKIIRLPQNRIDLVFEINEGDVTYIEDIIIKGNKEIASSDLIRALNTKTRAWYRIFTTSDVYDPDRLTLDRRTLETYAAERGYGDFRVLSANAELTPDKKAFYITFTVEEGIRYRVGKIQIVSSVPNLQTKELRELIELSERDWYSSKEVDRAIDRLTDEVGAKGFAFAEVTAQLSRHPEKGILDITFELTEGPRVFVERIEIIGNVRTRDEVIRREIPLHEGDAFNVVKLQKAEKNIRNLGYFKNVEFSVEPGSQPDRAKIIVRVEEQSTGEFTVAAGVSTLDGLLGTVGAAERNIGGTGNSAQIGATFAKKRQEYSIGFIKNYFLNRKIAAGGDAFHIRSGRIDAYEQVTTGATAHMSYDLSEYLSQMLSYSLYQDKVTPDKESVSIFVRQQAGTKVTSAVAQALTYDRRDNIFRPRSGYVARLKNTYAGVAGDVEYLQNTVLLSWYTELWDDIILNLKGVASTVEKISKKTIRIVDSLFLGADSFRGFEYGSPGPRDRITGDSLGATRSWVGTTEVALPTPFPDEFNMRWSIFSDFGWAGRPGIKDPVVTDSKMIRVSAGVSLIWDSPFGPFTIYYAKPIRKFRENASLAHDREQRIGIGFMTRF